MSAQSILACIPAWTKAAGLLVALSAGCARHEASDLPIETEWESPHFRYHSRVGDPVCPAVLDQLERHFTLMQAYLGFPWENSRKIEYYKFLDRYDYAQNSGCPAGSDSCTRESTVLTPHLLQPHELVHAYLAPIGRPPDFFVEGLASVLACRSNWTLYDPKPWRDVVLSPSDQVDAYAEGAWFVGDLLFRYGPERLLALYRGLDHSTASLDQVASVFASVYDVPLDAAWDTASNSSHQVRCLNLWQCNGAPLPLDGTVQTLEQACDASDHSRVLQIEEDVDVILSAGFPYPYGPVNCDLDLPAPVSGNHFGELLNPAVTALTAGRYFIQGSMRERADISARLLESKAYSRECAPGTVLDLAANGLSSANFDLTLPNDDSSWFVRLRPPDGRSLRWGRAEAIPEVQHCPNCDNCKPFIGTAIPEANGDVTLRVRTSASSESKYVTYTFLLQ